MKKRIIYILLTIILALLLIGCGSKLEEKKETTENVSENKETNEKDKETKGEDMKLNQIEGYREGNIKAKIKTNKGEMELILFPNVAPKAVENFVTHAKNGYYEGVIFHRVIEGFMIQGGDPTGTGMGGESIWKDSFEDEFDVNYRHFHGALSMANAGANTNGSQFFIVTAKNNVESSILSQMEELGEKAGYPKAVIEAYRELGGTYHLDGKHTVFGQVTKGMDVAINISKVKKDANDKPLEDVVIEKIEIVE